MKLLRSDLIALLTGAVVITTFSLLFYFNLTKKTSPGTGEIVGTISFKRKVAQRKYSAQVVWEGLEQNTPVYNNDSIRTAEFSEAVIRLKDGTEISLDQNSMILLSLSNNRLDIDFSQGSISAKRDNVKGEGIKNISFTSGGARVSIGKSNVVLNSNKQKQFDLFVSKGVARINAVGGITDVKANEKAIISKDNKLKIIPVTFKLNNPENSKFYITSKNKKSVGFSWKIFKKRGKVLIEVAKNRNFKKLIISRTVKVSRLKFSLEKGMYYWRLKAVEKGNALYSNINKFSIVQNRPPELNSPLNNHKYFYRKSFPIIYFSWSKSRQSSEYDFIISKDSSFKNIIRSEKTTKNSIALDSIIEGTYYWKVLKKVKIGSEINSIASRYSRFSIEKMKLLPAPAIIYPGNNKKFSKIFIEKRLLTFSWDKNREITESKITISRDRTFKNIVHSSVVNANSFNFVKRLKKGVYYWKVTGISDGVTATKSSPVKKFSIIDEEKIVLISPLNESVISPYKKGKIKPVVFKWRLSEMRGDYRFLLSKERIFNAAKEFILKKNFVQLKNLVPGKYFWKVSLLDRDKKSSLLKSNVNFIIIKDKLKNPIMEYPINNEVVDMSKSDELSLSWKFLKGAGSYRIKLYQIKGRTRKLIIDNKTSAKKIIISDLSKLDVGRFYWTIVASAFDNKGKVIDVSKDLRSNFSIVLGAAPDKPEINSLKVIKK